MNLSQETDEKRLMLLRAAAEHMSKKFTMKPQEVKPEGRRLIGRFHVRRVAICTAYLLDEAVAGNGRKAAHAASRGG